MPLETITRAVRDRNVVCSAFPDYVRSITEQAKRAGLGHNTLRRLIRTGEGPKVIKLSPRRLGIRDSAMNEWLASREASVA